jgi:hypothetical protein
VTDFDAPGASTACFYGLTGANGINAPGEITGNYYDSECNSHGFLRERNGAVTVIDVPGLIDTFPETINDVGRSQGGVSIRPAPRMGLCGTIVVSSPYLTSPTSRLLAQWI